VRGWSGFHLLFIAVWLLLITLMVLIFHPDVVRGQPSPPLNLRRVVAVPAWEPLRLEAETGELDGDMGKVIGNEYAIFAPGTLFFTFTVPTASSYYLTVRARGSIHAGVWPLMRIVVNTLLVDEVSVASTVLAQYQFTVDLVAGDNRIGLGFYNDAYTPGGEDRNLYVDWLELAAAPLSPPDPVNPHDAWTNPGSEHRDYVNNNGTGDCLRCHSLTAADATGCLRCHGPRW
jgi:hypothetical protein